jgi:uncharacterized damage-inducible protein DinB
VEALRKHLLDQANTELWAFNLWQSFIEDASNYYGGAQFRSQGERCLRHTIGCYVDWLDFVEEVETSRPDDFRDEKESEFKRLIRFIETVQLDQAFISEDQSRSWTAVTIIQHMLSHGAYHRGQLRQLAETAGLNSWPETDFFRNISLKI